MAQLGRLYYIVQDSSGTAQTGVSVEVRKQGAAISGSGSGTAGPGTVVISVDNPGGIASGDSVIQINSAGTVGTTVFTVNGVTPTTVSINTGGAITWQDDERLVPTGPTLPTIYLEPDGGTPQSNPIVTGPTGEAATWAFGGFYDLTLSGSSITTKNIPDVTIVGEINKTNVFTEATAVGFVWDTNRDLTTAGAKIISVRRNGTEKFYVDKDGGLGAATFAGAVSVTTGGLSVIGASAVQGLSASSLVVTPGPTTMVGGLTVTTGGVTIQAGGLTVTAGSVSLPAGSVTAASLAANISVTAPVTTLGAITDTAVTVAEVDRIGPTSYTFTAGNVGALIICQAPYQISTGGSTEGKVILRLYMETSAGSGTYVVKAWCAYSINESTRITIPLSFSWFEATVPTGVIRWKLTDSKVNTLLTPTVTYLGTFGDDGGTQRLAYMQIIEFKR